MKAVLLSIRPRWCELIASGKKTIEVRKTRPKLETPFKVYIYCTKPNTTDPHEILEIHGSDKKICRANGKVIGEFVCDEIIYIDYERGVPIMFRDIRDQRALEPYMTKTDWDDYANGRSALWGWHISDLAIYDKPMGLREFYKACSTQDCSACQFISNGICQTKLNRRVKRAPQSWCYVEVHLGQEE